MHQSFNGGFEQFKSLAWMMAIVFSTLMTMIIDNDYNDFDDDEDVYDDGQYWQKWRLVPQIMQQN